MDQGPDIGARSRGRRARVLVAALAAAGGLAAGAVLFGGGVQPAGANVSTWEDADIDGVTWTTQGAPFGAPQYGIDGEGFVHLRGIMTGNDAPVERIGGGTGGPWGTDAFTIGCGYTPANMVAVRIHGNEPVHGLEPYDAALMIAPDGTVKVLSWDAPVAPTDSDPQLVMDITVSLDSVTYEAAPSCETESTTTAPEETTTTGG